MSSNQSQEVLKIDDYQKLTHREKVISTIEEMSAFKVFLTRQKGDEIALMGTGKNSSLFLFFCPERFPLSLPIT